MISLKDIISITGKPGLYKVVAQAKNGAIVESIENNKRIPIHSREHISALESISIYTTEDEKPLKEIYSDIYTKENGGKTIEHTENIEELTKYLESVLPNYDKERVYASNIKKLFMWYNLLQSSGNLKWIEKSEEDTEDQKTILTADKNNSRNDAIGKMSATGKTSMKNTNMAKQKTITQRKSGGA